MPIDTGGRPFGEPILRIDEGERMYKIYRFTPKKSPGYYFEYRILTKQRKDGKLEMASYNLKIVDGETIKTNITRSKGILPKQMDDIIEGMKNRIQSMVPSNLEVIDLTKYKSIEKQIEVLQKLDKIDTHYAD